MAPQANNKTNWQKEYNVGHSCEIELFEKIIMIIN